MLIRWLTEPKKLSRNQKSILDGLQDRGQPFCLSAMTLVELAVIKANDGKRVRGDVGEIFRLLEGNPLCELLPITVRVAEEIARLGNVLRDPADRAIVASARLHGLTLLTSDALIVDSRLVTTVD